MAAMKDVDVVFVGEQHNDPVGHFLEAWLLQHAYAVYGRDSAQARPVALSLEMFQRDVQHIVDEYLADLITESHFLKSSRPWKNYKTDYRPMVEFAKAHHLPVIAANAPRRYANRVSRLGPASLEALSPEALAGLPPLPYASASEAYKQKWGRLMAEMMANMKKSAAADTAHADTAHVKKQAEHPMPKGPNHMLDAQAFWDANMAYSIHEHLEKTPNALVLHMAGSFHVEEGLGTPAQLEGYHPGVRHLIIAMEAEENYTTFDAERHSHQGDFVILTDKTLPRTYAL